MLVLPRQIVEAQVDGLDFGVIEIKGIGRPFVEDDDRNVEAVGKAVDEAFADRFNSTLVGSVFHQPEEAGFLCHAHIVIEGGQGDTNSIQYQKV